MRVWVLLGTGTFVGTRILFGPRASGPQTSFRMAPPRERGAGDAREEVVAEASASAVAEAGGAAQEEV